MLKLIEFDYVENKGLPNEWAIEKCVLGSINLFAGKNASGKSRILKALHSFAETISEWRVSIDSSKTVEWKLVFELESQDSIEFYLNMVRGAVVTETLKLNNLIVLSRDPFGKVEITKKAIVENIQVNPTELAVYELAHTHQFLEVFVGWADCFCYGFHSFTTSQVSVSDELPRNNAFHLFVNGKLSKKTDYIQSIIADINKIGYVISNLDVGIPTSGDYSGCILSSDKLPKCLFIREDGKNINTGQIAISKGMFRVLATLIKVNYLLLFRVETPSCFTIDDLGEGLDPKYASKLTKLLFDKFVESEFQLVVTTNNEYVMNAVPIEHWSLIEKLPNGVRFKNRHNSRKEIEEFNFLGLNNFDYFRQSQG